MLPLRLITAARLDVAALLAAVAAESDGGDRPGRAGAIASFVGVVRRDNGGRRVLRLEYEAYEPLARKALDLIAEEVSVRWPEATLGLHHRVGRLELGEVSVAIAAAAPHRADAFAACRYAIERVKQIAPIWKHEYFDGGETWIEGATADPNDEDARREAVRRACA